MTINATKWFDAEWAREQGLYSETFDTTEAMDIKIQELACTLSNSNPEAMKELKKIMWQCTDEWDQLFQMYKKYSTGAYTHVKSTLALGFNGPTPCKGTVCYDYSRYTLERFGPRVQLLRECAATIVGA